MGTIVPYLVLFFRLLADYIYQCDLLRSCRLPTENHKDLSNTMRNTTIFTTEKSKQIRMSICRSATYVSTSCYLSRGYLSRIKFNQLTIT